MRVRFSNYLKQAIATALSLAAIGLAPSAQAADFVVGVQELDYFPMYATDANGHYMGYARELLDLFANHSAHRFEYRVLPVKRLLNDYFLGRVDFMFPDNPRWDAEAKKALKVSYSAPAITFQDAVMVLPDRKGQPLQSLGTVRGFTPWKFMAQVRGGTLTLLPSTDSEYLLSSIQHPEVIRAFDQFLHTHQAAVNALKRKYGL